MKSSTIYEKSPSETNYEIAIQHFKTSSKTLAPASVDSHFFIIINLWTIANSISPHFRRKTFKMIASISSPNNDSLAQFIHKTSHKMNLFQRKEL